MCSTVEPAKITKRLAAKARDNHGFSYDVEMSIGGWAPGESYDAALGRCVKKPSTKWVLKIVGTPGSWYLDELLSGSRGPIYIDFGQNWMCTNFAEVLNEAASLL